MNRRNTSEHSQADRDATTLGRRATAGASGTEGFGDLSQESREKLATDIAEIARDVATAIVSEGKGAETVKTAEALGVYLTEEAVKEEGKNRWW